LRVRILQRIVPFVFAAVRRPLVILGAVMMTAWMICCGSTQSEASDVVRTSQRLQGVWRLVEFVPETPLEPPLESILRQQIGNLVLTFSSGHYSATGVGLNVSGDYEISGSEELGFSVVLYGKDGIASRVAGEFAKDGLNFFSLDSPWRGRGKLERIPG
jgi:hypothetical protein